MDLQVEELLTGMGIEYRLIRLSRRAFTVDDVIKYAQGDVKPTEICKTIILQSKRGSNKVAVLLRGIDKLDFSKIKKVIGEEMTIANSEQVKDAAGVEPGAVCPLLLSIPLLVDEKVNLLTRINCGSGSHLYGLEFKKEDLVKGVQYEIVDVSKDVKIV